MRIGPVIAVALAIFGAPPCSAAKGGKLDDDLRHAMSSPQYSLILSSTYRRFFTESPIGGYVKFVGGISGDSVIVRDVAQVQPGTVDIKTARALASRAKLSAGAAGSRLAPTVDVYVIFYDSDKPDKVALVFAAPAEASGQIQQTGKNYFIEIVEYHVSSQAKDTKKTAPAVGPGH